MDLPHTANLRIGDWDFYVVDIDEYQEFDRTLMVQFKSHSPHSYPILLLRRGNPPELLSGLLPTYEAFRADYGDQVCH